VPGFVAEKLMVTEPPGGTVEGEIDSVTEMLRSRTAADDGPASRSTATIASSFGSWRIWRTITDGANRAVTTLD